jgi:hypothetical protein
VTRRPRLALVGVGATAAAVALVVAGHGALAGPATGRWSTVESWYDAVGAATAAITALRLLAVGLAAWLAVAAALQLLSTFAPLRAVRHLADAVSPRALQRLAHGAAGLALTVGLAGPPAPPDPAGTAVMEVLEAGEPTPTTTTTTTRAPTPTTTSTTTPTPSTAPPSPTPSPPAPVPAPAPPPSLPLEEVVVAPGDSFWSLAVDAVTDRPARGEVDRYWRQLIEANRARLVDPGNPDLLYPGQRLRLPVAAAA